MIYKKKWPLIIFLLPSLIFLIVFLYIPFFNNIKKEIPNNKFIGEIDFFEPINNDKEEAMKKAVIWIKELIE